MGLTTSSIQMDPRSARSSFLGPPSGMFLSVTRSFIADLQIGAIPNYHHRPCVEHEQPGRAEDLIETYFASYFEGHKDHWDVNRFDSVRCDMHMYIGKPPSHW